MERIESYEKEIETYLFTRMTEDSDPDLGVTILGSSFDDDMVRCSWHNPISRNQASEKSYDNSCVCHRRILSN